MSEASPQRRQNQRGSCFSSFRWRVFEVGRGGMATQEHASKFKVGEEVFRARELLFVGNRLMQKSRDSYFEYQK